MKKNVLAIILALCMVIAMLPAPAFAAHTGEKLTGMMVPTTVGELESSAVEPNAKSYKVTLTGEGNGEVELLVDSPAEVGSEVYFMANPDDGYLAEVYYEGLADDALVYVGADIVGFIMPANKVTLNVKFVAAEGDNHSVSVFEYGDGEYALSRQRAKEYESVLLAVLPDDADSFDPLTHVYVSRGLLFYLFEEEGVHYYEIIMPDDFVTVAVAYEKVGPNYVGMLSAPEGGTVTIDPQRAYFLDTVTVTIVPDPGYYLARAVASSHAGEFNTELTPIGNNQYTFTMHAESVDLFVTFESDPHSITVNAGPGGTAYADMTESPSGRLVTVTCVPDAGYEIDSVTGTVDLFGKSDNEYYFYMPAEDAVIDVTFKGLVNPITVTVDTGIGGTAYTEVEKAATGDSVKLVCTPEEGYRVAQITGVDAADNGDGTYTFTMPAKAADIHVLFLRENNPFLDVNETHFFHDPVLWAVEKGITNGIDDTHFGPYLTTNRAAVVTMLWRYAGSPEPETTENPFVDVPADTWFTKPVLWAVENGITNGLTADTFGPNEICNRAQVVTFLYRALKASAPEGVENPFEDVPAGEWYEAPVLWALANGVTTGADATHFNPNGECLRAQFVTFLYRADQIPEPEPEPEPTDPTEPEVPTEPTEPTEPEVPTDPTEPTEPEVPTDPTEPTEPEEPTEPAVTYNFILKDNGYGKVSYKDGVTSAAPGESIFFYAVPDEGYYLSGVEVFNPNNEIDISKVLVYSHGDNLYELVMIDHEIIMTCVFEPIPNT